MEKVTSRDGGPQLMKRKYQVFISSTFMDLAEHRFQAMLGILKAGHLPLALEHRGLETSPREDVIKAAIADCQYYVLILGPRYGSIAAGQPAGVEKGYVELELDYAISKGLHVLAFLMPEHTVREARNQLARPGDSVELASEKRYWDLYRRLAEPISGPFYRPFSTPTDIFTELFGFFSADHSDVRGYIPEPEEEDANILRISSSNEILRDAIQQLGEFTFVDPRLSIAKEKKLALAKAFAQLHGDHIQSKWKRVFIESGSTMVYITRELIPYLPRMGSADERRVTTNNSLAYLYLWLCSKVLCHPEPDGPPDNKYGGMFGPLTGRNRIPDYRMPSLDTYDPDAVGLVHMVRDRVFPKVVDRKQAILLAAASGLQLSDVLTAVTPDEPPVPLRDEAILQDVRKCRGFHGGSYQNRLFKMAMFQTNIPAIVFLHDEKIDCPVRVGECHFLCDHTFTWDGFVETYPLSIWVACESSTVARVRKKVQDNLQIGGWTSACYGESTRLPIVMASNKAFRDACQRIGVTLYQGA
jgi:hypothetical protein